MPRARRGRPRRRSRADGRAREASAPSLACGAPGGVPTRERERDAAPSPVRKSSPARAGGESGNRARFRNLRGKKSKILARSMTGRLWQELRTKRTRTRTTHRARARGWFPSFTTRATRQRRDTMSQEGGVSARCAATVPAATRAPMPHPTPLLFLLSCARVSRICCRAKENEAARPAVRRRLALAADTPPSRWPPSVPPQRPSGAAAPPRPRARASAHRKTDGRRRKRPSQRRGSARTAPRGGRAEKSMSRKKKRARGCLW